MNRIIENNQVTISGEIASGFKFSHEIFGENFYIVNVKVQRLSGACDTIPVTVSDRLIDVSEDYTGKYVSVTGQFRSYNKQDKDSEKKRLILSVFAREFDLLGGEDDCYYDNYISLDGFICKEPIYRETPLGREVADLLLAVNRPYGKSDYIPCICWGRNAMFVSNLETGTHIKVEGRIQSREYRKKISETEFEIRTAYEVSVNKIELVEEP